MKREPCPGVTVVPMERRWIPAIASLEKECFAHPWCEETLVSELSNPTACFFIAVSDIGHTSFLGQPMPGRALPARPHRDSPAQGRQRKRRVTKDAPKTRPTGNDSRPPVAVRLWPKQRLPYGFVYIDYWD